MINNDEKGNVHKNIQLVIFFVIIAVAAVIVISALTAGSVFLTKSITKAIEDDLIIAVDIADKYVSGEINILKIKAAEAAKDYRQLSSSGARDALQRISSDYSQYIGLAVFSEKGLLEAWGEIPINPDLFREPFLALAFKGGQAVSTTMYAPDGTIVMYVSAPISEGYALAAVLPGLHFSDLVSEFTFWQSGHFFIDDEDGYVISNYRRQWVEQRINFIHEAKTNDAYKEIAVNVQRGVDGERGVGRFIMGGEPRICAFRPISSESENWFIGIIAPVSESALSNIPGGIFLIGVITIIMSFIAAVLGSLFLKRPYEEVDRLRRAAEIASISKSTFLANMSHEIRTPMNSIMGFSELAMDGDISKKTRDYLANIHSNTQWLLQIINDILDISKIESGKMELEFIPFDMHELFNSCRTLIMPKAIEKGIMLHFYAEPSMGTRPVGDPTRLRQIFVNLLSNAVKFTNTGMIKIHAEIKDRTDTTVTMRFEIKDSGIGMTKDQIEKVFNPFTQAESGTTRKYGGTGLGLSITKSIVELMGGELMVESTPGVGSKFSFEITFETIDISKEELENKKIVLDEIEKPLFEGEVLLCEDNPMNQQVICEHLARVGLKTVVAENGRIGVNMVKGRKKSGEKQFDLIFMDMHMPVMDGLEASEEILKLDTGTPMVALTANIMSNDKEIYKSHGMADCVGKPFTSQELWKCLLKYFTPLNKESKENKSIPVDEDTAFFKKMEVMFVKNNLNKYEEFSNALSSGDIRLAHRLVHTLKSNAGQIGRSNLQQAASEVENSLKNEKNEASEEQLGILKKELDYVLNELYPLLEEENNKPKAAQPAAMEPEKEKELLEKLEPLLKSGNPDSTKLVNELRAITGSEILIRFIEDFEFENAHAALMELRK
jgi:signal transduction histidine kinase/DNA-binding response OmpR family regulator